MSGHRVKIEGCEMCAELRRQVARLEAQVDTLHAAVLQAADNARTLPPVPTLPVKAPDPIAEAIRETAKKDAALRAHLFGWVKQERRKPAGTEGKLSEDQILHRLLNWDSPTEQEGILV